MFVTVWIGTMTLRGVRTMALAVVLALLSFLLFSVLCSTDAHGSPVVGHSHAADPTHTDEPIPSGHCHHDREPVRDKAELDRALPRPDNASWDPRPADHGVPVSSAAAVSTVLSGHGTARPDTSGPPRSGRLLLIILSVARN